MLEKGGDYVVAKEGARAYSIAMWKLVEQTEQALKDVENNQKGEMEDE